MKTKRQRSRLEWFLLDLWFTIVFNLKYVFWSNLKDSQFWKIRLPLRIALKFNLDVWYATRVLGWEYEKPHQPWEREPYHFHDNTGNVIRPSDYGYKSPQSV